MSSLIETSASFDLEALRREEFPAVTAGDTVFLNHASTGPLPTRSIARTRERAAGISPRVQAATIGTWKA